jgi:pimeloyl-ACP methyl ester carboxylesterase
VWTSSTDKEIETFLGVFRGEGALKGGLNWYRANLGSKNITGINFLPNDIITPTLFIWGNQDPALGRKGAELTLQYMKGPYYRFIEIDAGHWLIQDAYDEVSEAILDHLELITPIVEQQLK